MSSRALTDRTVKVTFGDDVRRLKIHVPDGAAPKVAVASIQSAIQLAFQLPEDCTAQLLLKYVDDEGDRCTLMEHTLEDFISTAPEGLLRLCAEFLPSKGKVSSGRLEPLEVSMSSATLPEVLEDMADPLPLDGCGPQEGSCTIGGIDASSAAECEQQGQPVVSSEVAQLMAMGFAEDTAKEALAASRGNQELAVEYLLNGQLPPPSPITPQDPFQAFRTLLQEARGRLVELQQQLREVVGRQWERRSELRARAGEEGRERLQRLQATIEELRIRLRGFGQQSKGAATKVNENVKGRLSDFHGEATEKLGQLDAQLADAQQFLGETVAALRGRVREGLRTGATTAAGTHQTAPADGAAAATSEGTADDSAAVSEETAEAAAAASELAALAALDMVDEFLIEDGALGATDVSDSASFPSLDSVEGGASSAQPERPQSFLGKFMAVMRPQTPATQQAAAVANVTTETGSVPALVPAVSEEVSAAEEDGILLEDSSVRPVHEGTLGSTVAGMP